MRTVADVIVAALTPYTGQVAADTCVRATALALGKTSDDLSTDDLPALESNVRRTLEYLLSTSKIDSLISEIDAGVKQAC